MRFSARLKGGVLKSQSVRHDAGKEREFCDAPSTSWGRGERRERRSSSPAFLSNAEFSLKRPRDQNPAACLCLTQWVHSARQLRRLSLKLQRFERGSLADAFTRGRRVEDGGQVEAQRGQGGSGAGVERRGSEASAAGRRPGRRRPDGNETNLREARRSVATTADFLQKDAGQGGVGLFASSSLRGTGRFLGGDLVSLSSLPPSPSRKRRRPSPSPSADAPCLVKARAFLRREAASIERFPTEPEAGRREERRRVGKKTQVTAAEHRRRASSSSSFATPGSSLPSFGRIPSEWCFTGKSKSNCKDGFQSVQEEAIRTATRLVGKFVFRFFSPFKCRSLGCEPPHRRGRLRLVWSLVPRVAAFLLCARRERCPRSAASCASGIFILKAAEEYYGLDGDVGGQELAQHLAALDLEHGATEADIRRSYRSLSVKLHPDRNPNCGLACQQRFQEVASAYEFLMRRERKRSQRSAAGEEGEGLASGKDGDSLKTTSHGVVDFSDLSPDEKFFPSSDTKHVWCIMVRT